MMRLEHRFVEFIPKELENNVLYISIRFRTAIHKCACGCGIKTVTPLSPTDWKLIFNGKSVSLDPSIGNWSFPCQSHYWIYKNKIEWAQKWSREKIEKGKEESKNIKKEYYNGFGCLKKSKDSSKLKKLWRKFTWLFDK
ncbi:DUF6527 family protein [Polaribacter gochangensis]|uniref:DUF6527 family protein n=1 Tax=Polaribacter gochangensis TaxID=3252903 RepID=UPI0039049520